MENLNVFNILSLKQTFWKPKPFSKIWITVLEFILILKRHHFHLNLQSQNAVLTQLEWQV